jgi:8-oxo-dGTP pyrophosphatase MutT (NUDIX family)
VKASRPAWLSQLVGACASVTVRDLSRLETPATGGRESAVLILFGEGPRGPDVLLIERSRDLKHHPGQAAFPGGGAEPGDDGPASTALREAVEETGLDPMGVEVLSLLPTLWVPPSDNRVTPVLAWWRDPSAVWAVDPAEVAAVARVPIAALADPANRFRTRHPSGHIGAAFDVGDLFVWGFTAGVLDRLLDLAGWARPWDHADVRDLPAGR